MCINLTPKQEKFCQLYVKLGNASKAYRQAYDAERMKSNTIEKRSCELVKKGKIAGRIKEIQTVMAIKLDISPERTLQEWTTIGFADIRSLFDVNNNLIPFSQWPDDIAAAVMSFDVKADGSFKLKLWSKIQALDALSKNLGLFEKHNWQKNTGPPQKNGLHPILAEMIREINHQIQNDVQEAS